jgi:DNA-binding response OmpR family regulator
MLSLPRQSSGKILVADDDPVARESISAILVRRGFECAKADSGEEVCALLEREEFDLIVSDIRMPGNEGLEMAAKLSSLQHSVPLILITGQPTLETAIQAVKLRVIGYLTKPTDQDELLRLVKTGIDRTRASRLLRGTRIRLEKLIAEIRHLEQTEKSNAHEPLGTYIALSMENLLISIADLRSLLDGVVAEDGGAAAQQRLAASRPFLLLDAIRETILVLERSRTAFKSRELAELRQKLESLLRNKEPHQ